MRNQLISIACGVGAVVITILLSAVALYYEIFGVVALVSIIWAALDAQRVQFWRYRTGISGGSTVIFALFLILGWPIVFPWYLRMRLKIATGTARLREEYEPWQMSDTTIGPSGLRQPWRGRKL